MLGAKKNVVYVGQIRPEPEEGQTAFFGAVLSTMTYDLCGFAHAGVETHHPGCAGCGECVRLGTWDLLREDPGAFSRLERKEPAPSPTVEEFLRIVEEHDGTFPRGVDA
ncbi:MAG: hypothetical protein QCI38_03090 [Candidatus Thermoplasmatota archaeon]|nr:hypothetical protein [Candidatus Thermoplasmatota archaeon]